MANNSSNVYFTTNISKDHSNFKLSFHHRQRSQIYLKCTTPMGCPWALHGSGEATGVSRLPALEKKVLVFCIYKIMYLFNFVLVFAFCNCVFVCPPQIDSTVPNPTNLCYPALIEVVTPSALFFPLIPTLGQNGQALTSSAQRPGHILFIVLFHVSFYF